MNKTWKKSQFAILKKYENEKQPTPEIVNGIINTIDGGFVLGIHKNYDTVWMLTDLMSGCAISAPLDTQREAKELATEKEQAISAFLEKNKARQGDKIAECIEIMEKFKHEQGLKN